MMNNKKYLLSFVFVFILLSMSLSSAWIVPDSHDWIAQSALEKAPNTQVSQVISQNYEDFSACMSLTDYSVFFYFSSGFSTIGKQYLASHNNLICPRAVELADKNNPAQLSCAYGICGMEFEDSPSHNGFVVNTIEKSGLVNGLIHASAEQCVNDQISTSQLNSEGRASLVNKYPVHKDFLIKVFQSDSRAATIDVGKLMDSFVAEVSQNNEYTVGFRGFTSVPLTIHLILLMIFLINVTGMALLIKKKNKGTINKITIGITFFFVLLIMGIYALYLTGNIWRAFQIANKPICWVLPTSGYESYLNQAVDNMVNFYNNGASAIYQVADPSGLQALHNADAENTWKLWIISFVLLSFAVLLVWLNIRKKK